MNMNVGEVMDRAQLAGAEIGEGLLVFYMSLGALGVASDAYNTIEGTFQDDVSASEVFASFGNASGGALTLTLMYMALTTVQNYRDRVRKQL